MSDSEHSTVTYTSVSFPVEDDSDIGSPGVDGTTIYARGPYALHNGWIVFFCSTHSPDYIPGPEVPPSPDYIPGPEVPPSPDNTWPQRSPQSPPPWDFVPVSRGAERGRADPEEDPADYPADGDVDDDEDEDEDEDVVEEEHLAPADSVLPGTTVDARCISILPTPVMRSGEFRAANGIGTWDVGRSHVEMLQTTLERGQSEVCSRGRRIDFSIDSPVSRSRRQRVMSEAIRHLRSHL
ncbi:hypothetical protein Tco_0485493 [Tanacetum coccineum]